MLIEKIAQKKVDFKTKKQSQKKEEKIWSNFRDQKKKRDFLNCFSKPKANQKEETKKKWIYFLNYN